ncbi:MAG: pantetheine-phosphate adenylyltransferase [Candidatus Caldarchaeum sp.]|nr:pantetheine-phosphate adenylyltransferase [Candidatus Caldarchaeum sp.]
MSPHHPKIDWHVLVETVQALPLYPVHKAYVRDKILLNEPDVSPEELVKRLGITRGEALVILWELRKTGEEVLQILREGCLEKPRFTLAALGGTFSTLHAGHMALLLTAFCKAEKVLIGVSSDSFASKLSKNHPIPAYEERVRNLKRFLDEQGWLGRSQIIPLEDPYGPSVEDPTIEALVVSPATAGRAVEINAKRAERMMRPLEVLVCPLVVAEDGRPISTTRVMAGEVSVDGKVRKG